MEIKEKISNIIGPLSFKDNINEEGGKIVSSNQLFYPITQCHCMLCDDIFSLPDNRQEMLTHLFNQHRLIIADVEQIAVFSDYIQFWKTKFIDKELAEYCCTMLLDKTPDGQFSKNEKYYLLSDVVPVDHELRRDLQRRRLERLLALQAAERSDNTYQRECLFCRTILNDTRANFLLHLLEKHNFYIAKTENLVFVEELIEILSNKLDNCVCIYCEKIFKDRIILKEHMRKKSHKRINPNNKEYDRFFITNYLEMGKNWQSYLKNVGLKQNKKKSCSSANSEKSRKSNKESSSDTDANWSDWEERESASIICLFCKHAETKYPDIVNHMNDEHQFKFNEVTEKLNFYEKVKVVNYIRRQIHILRCISCDVEFINANVLLQHMSLEKHFTLEDRKVWDQPEFYFSTYDDDGLLCCLEDNDDQEEGIEDVTKATSSCVINSHDCDISEQVALAVLQD